MNTFSFIMSYLNQILTAAQRAGLSPERQTSIMDQFRNYFEGFAEEVLKRCVSRLEEARVRKMPDLRDPRVKGVILKAGDMFWSFKVEREESSEIMFVPTIPTKELIEESLKEQPGEGHSAENAPFIDSTPRDQILGYACCILLWPIQASISPENLALSISPENLALILREIMDYLEKLSDAELHECFLELEKLRSAYRAAIGRNKGEK